MAWREKDRPNHPFAKKKGHGGGRITQAERNIVKTFVHDQKGDVTERQELALGHLLARKPSTIKRLIEAARDDFTRQAKRYVEIHRIATEKALETGNHEVALKGSQWAMTHISSEGVRIIDKVSGDEGFGGTKVLIGVQLGGLAAGDVKPVAIEGEVTNDE